MTAPYWTKAHITIDYQAGKLPGVYASVFRGQLAVHRRVKGCIGAVSPKTPEYSRRCWVVTHIGTGMRLPGKFGSKAKAVAALLRAMQIHRDWRFNDPTTTLLWRRSKVQRLRKAMGV